MCAHARAKAIHSERGDGCGRRGSFDRGVVSEGHVHDDTVKTKKSKREGTAIVITMQGITINVRQKS